MPNEFAEILPRYQLVVPINRVSHKFSATFDKVYCIFVLIVQFHQDDITPPVWSQKSFDDMRQIAEQVKVVVWWRKIRASICWMREEEI